MLIRSRREFLTGALKTIGAVGALGSLAKFGEINALAGPSSGYQALVCIFLNGGNDGHNTVIPVTTSLNSYAKYSAGRGGPGGLALPVGSLKTINNGNDVYGLHPSMPEIQALYNAGSAAVLANVGMLVQPLDRNSYNSPNSANKPNALFSHSDQSSQWQSAIPTGLGSTGWGGRIADYMQPTNAGAQFTPITSTTGCGIFCTGAQTFPSTVPVGGASLLNGTQGNASRLTGQQQLLTFDNGLQLVQSANGVMNRGMGFSNALNAALANISVTTAFPAGNLLGAQLQTVAKIIKGRTTLGLTKQIFFCQLGGFDTHGAQLQDQATLLQQLSQAVGAFQLCLQQELQLDDRVTTFTASEFGRTLTPNGNGGTNHAWGSHHFVFGRSAAVAGGWLQGGQFYGQFPDLTLGSLTDTNSRGTLIPTTSVDQYAATMAQWFGVAPASIPQIFPYVGNFGNSNLGFLG